MRHGTARTWILALLIVSACHRRDAADVPKADATAATNADNVDNSDVAAAPTANGADGAPAIDPAASHVAPTLDDAASFVPLGSDHVKDAIHRALRTGQTQRWQDGALSGYAVPSIAPDARGCRSVRYTVDQLRDAPPRSITACEG